MGRSYELFVTFLSARSNISGQAEDLMNDRIGLSDQEQLLDLRQNFLHCLVAVAGDQDYAVKDFLEGRLPAGIELAIVLFGSSIVQTFRASKLTGLEGTVANIIGDTQLCKQKTNLCQLRSNHLAILQYLQN